MDNKNNEVEKTIDDVKEGNKKLKLSIHRLKTLRTNVKVGYSTPTSGYSSPPWGS